MRTIPIAYTALGTALFLGCATNPPTSRDEARASVLGYAREYPAYPATHSLAHQRLVIQTFDRGLNGHHRALARIFTDYDTFGSGDCEAWFKVPWDILCVLGDERFATFVASQPAHVQNDALHYLVSLFGGSERELRHRFPKTARLYFSNRPGV